MRDPALYLPAVQTLLVDHLGIEPERATPAATLDDLNMDSLDAVDIAMAAEERFGVIVDDAELEALTTVGGILDLLAAKDAAIPPAHLNHPEPEAPQP